MTENTNQVSVLIAAWNAEATLSRAVECALGQEGVAVEVIIVDDASTDGTAVLAKAFAARDSRVRVLEQTKNGGPAAARNRALDAATAPFVTMLDSDDAMKSGRLSAMLALARDGGWDMVADDLYKVDTHDPGARVERLWTGEPIGQMSLDFEAFVRGNLSELHGGRGELGFLKPLMRRDFLTRHALRYDETMRLGEDYALYATALARGARFCLTDPMGYFALVRPDSLSGKHSAADLRALVAADHALAKEPSLGPRDHRVLRRHETETQKRWRWQRLIDAVKDRDVPEALRCFATRPGIAADLLGKLWEQVVLRSGAAIRRRTRKNRSAEANDP